MSAGRTNIPPVASNVTNTPAGNIAATTVQAALNELDSEKQPLASVLTTFAGFTTFTSGNVVYANGTTWVAGTADAAGLVAKSGTQTGIAGDKTWTGRQTFASDTETALAVSSAANSTGLLATFTRTAAGEAGLKLYSLSSNDLLLTSTKRIGLCAGDQTTTKSLLATSSIIAIMPTGSNFFDNLTERINFGGSGDYAVAWSRWSTTTEGVPAFKISQYAVDNTHASRKYGAKFYACDTADREFMRAEASGSVAKVGFFGATAVVQQSAGTVATDAASTQALANALRTLVINLGLGA